MREIQICGGSIASIDEDDFERVNRYVWSLEQGEQGCYAVCYLDPGDLTRCLRMHGVIVDPQPHEVVDHIDGNGLNNQRSNLRVYTQAENCRNRRKFSGWTSAFKGVSLAKGRGVKCWRAQIRHGEKVRNLGYFATEEEAARAYDAAALEVLGEFARRYFPSTTCP